MATHYHQILCNSVSDANRTLTTTLYHLSIDHIPGISNQYLFQYRKAVETYRRNLADDSDEEYRKSQLLHCLEAVVEVVIGLRKWLSVFTKSVRIQSPINPVKLRKYRHRITSTCAAFPLKLHPHIPELSNVLRI